MLLSSLDSGTEESEPTAARGFNCSELSLLVADDNSLAQLLNADTYSFTMHILN